MSGPPMSNYGVKNALQCAFNCLRSMDRLVGDSLQSPYELFHENLAKSLSKVKKIEFSIPNSEVEAFYLKRSSENDFIASVQSKVLSKVCTAGGNGGGQGAATAAAAGGANTFAGVLSLYAPLFAQVWDMLCETDSDLCSKLPSASGKLLWEIFLKLDTENEMRVHVDDVVEVVVRIFQANEHNESEDTVKDWFHGDEAISFRQFFDPLVENYLGLLQVQILKELNHKIVNEFFKEGKLEKKGHVVHNWKMRWFVLTGTSLVYYETQDKNVAKGSLVINSNAVVQNMPEYRARPYRFRVMCGETKTMTEISAMDSKTMQDWIYTIRMAIKLHQTPGRNFLHKWKQVSATKSNKKGVTHSTSVDRVLAQPPSHPPPVHRGLSATKSVPDTRKQYSTELDSGQRSTTPSSPTSPNGTVNSKGFDTSSYTDPPPLPPQRFGSPDVQDINSTQVFDKAALVEKRIHNQKLMDKRRHSSMEPDEIEHFSVHGEDYAVVKKSPKIGRKASNKDIAALISPSVNAQLSVDATRQVEKWSTKDGAERTNGHVPSLEKNSILDKPAGALSSREGIVSSPKKKPPPQRHISDQGSSVVSSKENGGVDYANVDTAAKKKKKKSADGVPTPKPPPSPSAARKKMDAVKSRSPQKHPEKRRDNPSSQDGSLVASNNIDYAVLDIDMPKKPSPESPIQSERKKIAYSTVVFPNMSAPPEPGEQKKVRDFDKTNFDYSTIVFGKSATENIASEDQKNVQATSGADKKKPKFVVQDDRPQEQASRNLASPAAKTTKKSIYDSDEEQEEPPYVNVRRDGRPMNPPVVPPRRGAAAVTDDSYISDDAQ